MKTPREMERIIEARRKLLESIPAKSATVTTLKLLLQEIKDETGESLGFNTLRRFFGLLPCGEPSSKTWSVLTAYLRSKRIISRVQSNDFMTIWKTTHQLNSALSRSTIEKIIEYLLENRSTNRYPYLLGTATNHYMAVKDLDALMRLYAEDRLFINFKDFADYLSEIVGILFRAFEDTEREALEPLVMQPNFKNSIIYFFIDYEHLNGYYGDILQKIVPSSKHESIFLNCILNYRQYLSAEIFPKQLHTVHYNELKSMYPVLTGRYLGMMLLNNPNDAKKIWHELIVPLTHVHRPHLLFLELMPALLLTHQFQLLKWAYNDYYEELYELEHWFGHLTLNLYLISESTLYLSEMDLKRAKLIFDSIELDKTSTSYYFYVKLFWAIPAFHIALRLGQTKTELEKIQTEYQLSCTRAQFNRLSSPFLESYFSMDSK